MWVLKLTKNDRAVSSVVGIILMVAITVTLAALASTIGFQLAQKSLNPTVVGATAQKDPLGNILVTWQGGPDNGKVTSYDISIDGVQQAHLPPIPGSQTTFPISDPSAMNHVLVIANFSDGSSQVVLNYYL